MCIAHTTIRKLKIDLDGAQLESGFAALVARHQRSVTSIWRAFFIIPANQPPWLDTGVSPKPRQFHWVCKFGADIHTVGRGESGVRVNFPMMSRQSAQDFLTPQAVDSNSACFATA
jgi:hypothetical protein